VKHTSLISPIY